MSNILKILRFDRAKTPIHIFEQLRLEEALFRTDTNNWIVINDGSLASPSPSVVLGISGKPKVMCNIQRLEQENVPLFRRFTGGGTVVVGKGTTFISLIGNKKMLDPKNTNGPRELMKWSGEWYSNALEKCGVDVTSQNSRHAFALRENDYVLGNRKFAGNAQGLSRDRFVHHTSILWDFTKKDMQLLQNPSKQPEYRQKREHDAFLIPLKETMQTQDLLPNALIAQMMLYGFEIDEIDPDDSFINEILSRKHHKSNKFVNIENEKLNADDGHDGPNLPYNIQKRWQ